MNTTKDIKKKDYSLSGLLLPVAVLIVAGCVSEFVPTIGEKEELLVVQALITDQPETYFVRLSKSIPMGETREATPLGGCTVSISDDLGNRYGLTETLTGTYATDSPLFRGEIGRTYVLHVSATEAGHTLEYESDPMEMLPVPPIDSVYWEKTIIREPVDLYPGIDGCQIYLNTTDPEGICRYFRWDYEETWELRLPFDVVNQTCWISDRSNSIDIKSTAALEKSMINRHPVNFISNVTDRLKKRYSILVNQYSLNEDEYLFWERLQNMTVQVGGLYDIIPASIPSNIRCVENPDEKVLGYFSVSAKSSKRIFIQDHFAGIIDPYADCVTDTVYSSNPPGLNTEVWILLTHYCSMPCLPTYEITTHRECTDCTLRGSAHRPEFWIDDK